jgi:hypothetical protein
MLPAVLMSAVNIMPVNLAYLELRYTAFGYLSPIDDLICTAFNGIRHLDRYDNLKLVVPVL